jgi:hypothetical protein
MNHSPNSASASSEMLACQSFQGQGQEVRVRRSGDLHVGSVLFVIT